ncbi:MAG TPA: saccharopine dehydrogenase NADP-binding domain-containing protein [Euzebya sp.]|nr:saccharopine dehydrogenase NADP-binding domain-containing protein [Euzebya sp.]
MPDRDLDLVVYGATGFTGRLVAAYLVERTAGSDLRWALAGRSEERLHEVASDIGRPDLPLVVADSDDLASVAAMAEATKVVCTTVGPYARYGSPVVAACVEAGTDYCDLTGEVQWIRRMIDAHQARAAQTGARIVHTCGFDSIPSDLGTWYVQSQMHQRHGVHASRVSFRLKAARGWASGGTIASMMDLMEEAGADRGVRKVMADPYALMPEGERTGPEVHDAVVPTVDPDFGEWIGPFAMAVVNTRVVRRSNALMGYPWGREFRYDEAILMGSGPLGAVKAGGLAGWMGVGMAAMAVGPVRSLAARVLPKPGEGPSAGAQRKGFFDIRLFAPHPTDPNKNLIAKVHGDRDPGYGSTSRMLAESALCLAAGESTVGGGHWTPASALGQPLLDRLQTHAGVTFSVLE